MGLLSFFKIEKLNYRNDNILNRFVKIDVYSRVINYIAVLGYLKILKQCSFLNGNKFRFKENVKMYKKKLRHSVIIIKTWRKLRLQYIIKLITKFQLGVTAALNWSQVP